MPFNILTASPLPAATRDLFYEVTLEATDGTPPYSAWNVASGDLPPGLVLTGDGILSGVPTGIGTYNFTVGVIDSTFLSATQDFALTVSEASHFANASQLDDCDSMIKSVLNASETWGGDVADPRRFEEAVAKSRIFGTLEVIKAIAGNLQHGYWGVLASLVRVENGAFLPFHLGAHGLPLIANVRRFAASSKLNNAITIHGDGTVDDRDIGATFRLYSSGFPYDVLIAASINSLIGSQSFEAHAYTVGVTGLAIPYDVDNPNALDIIDADYMAGMEADPDEIDSYRNDRNGLFGTRHDSYDENGIRSELSGYWSIVNKQLKFTGYECKVPLIQFYEADCVTRTPYAYLSTIVKLSPLWNLKEGDNLVGIAQTLVNAGMDDLKQIAAGAMTVTPVSDIMPVQSEL